MINKSICVMDDGLFQSWAETLTRYFEKVYYFAPWQESDNKIDKWCIGRGMDGVERIEYLHEVEDQIDIFFFTDINFADEQHRLRDKGKQVWGLGWAEEYESDRRLFYDYLKSHKMSVNKYVEIDGIKNLKEYLLTRKDEGYVKASKFRYNWESYFHQDPEMSEEWVDAKMSDMGARGDEMEFVIEDMFNDAIEIGNDNMTLMGEIPEYSACGFEVKNKLYLCRIMKFDDMPEQVKKSTKVMLPLFKEMGSIGSYSTEVRVNNKGDDRFIDLAARQGNPPGSCLQEAWENWGEIIDKWTQGIWCEPIPAHEYLCEAHVLSDFCATKKTLVKYPKEHERYIKMKQFYIKDGKRYKIPKPGYKIVASVVGVGKTPEEAIEMMKEIIKTVECNEVDYQDGFMHKAIKSAKEMDQYGMECVFEFNDEADGDDDDTNEKVSRMREKLIQEPKQANPASSGMENKYKTPAGYAGLPDNIKKIALVGDMVGKELSTGSLQTPKHYNDMYSKKGSTPQLKPIRELLGQGHL